MDPDQTQSPTRTQSTEPGRHTHRQPARQKEQRGRQDIHYHDQYQYYALCRSRVTCVPPSPSKSKSKPFYLYLNLKADRGHPAGPAGEISTRLSAHAAGTRISRQRPTGAHSPQPIGDTYITDSYTYKYNTSSAHPQSNHQQRTRWHMWHMAMTHTGRQVKTAHVADQALLVLCAVYVSVSGRESPGNVSIRAAPHRS